MLKGRVGALGKRCTTVLGASVVAILGLPCARAAAGTVDVFPIPGGRLATPETQITFRGLPASQLGTIVVTGSSSGEHAGTLKADSDGQGGSFLPTSPFKSGELVTVKTHLNVLGANHGTFRFRIAEIAGHYGPTHWPRAPRTRGDVWHFHSRKDIVPDAVSILRHGPAGPGYIFVAPQQGPVQDGAEILDQNGNVVWFRPVTGDQSVSNFSVQRYHGSKVLTWWQGFVTGGIGSGEDVIANSAYQIIGAVHAANGLRADLHEFQLVGSDKALITAYSLVRWDARAVGGAQHQIVLDAVVQEIDIPTGLVLFQWDSLDHVPISSSYYRTPGGRNTALDYFHLNSIDLDQDGNFLISSRNTWAAYKVSHATGKTIWTLGGKHSSFRLGPGAAFAYQHDVRVRSAGDWFITMFDDGGGPPTIHPSRGLKLFLDTKHMTATVVDADAHSPGLKSSFEGNYQQLRGGGDFVGWGQEPFFSEFNSRGLEVWDARFKDDTATYRAYKFTWTGSPTTVPTVVGASHGRTSGVWVSWNGSTRVTKWRVQGGASPSSLHGVTAAAKTGFETPITFRRERWVAVQALDGHGRVLATSATVKIG